MSGVTDQRDEPARGDAVPAPDREAGPDRAAGPDGAAELASLRAELDGVERSVVSHVDPGRRAVVITAAVLGLLIAPELPWAGSTSGWRLLLGEVTAFHIGVLPRLFGVTALAFGVVLSVLALALRRWGLVWACALGCAFSVVDGVLAVWSRQTLGGPGVGVGLVLAVLAVLVLAVVWMRLAWARPY